jgi:hypothetical protein
LRQTKAPFFVVAYLRHGRLAAISFAVAVPPSPRFDRALAPQFRAVTRPSSSGATVPFFATYSMTVAAISLAKRSSLSLYAK